MNKGANKTGRLNRVLGLFGKLRFQQAKRVATGGDSDDTVFHLEYRSANTGCFPGEVERVRSAIHAWYMIVYQLQQWQKRVLHSICAAMQSYGITVIEPHAFSVSEKHLVHRNPCKKREETWNSTYRSEAAGGPATIREPTPKRGHSTHRLAAFEISDVSEQDSKRMLQRFIEVSRIVTLEQIKYRRKYLDMYKWG